MPRGSKKGSKKAVPKIGRKKASKKPARERRAASEDDGDPTSALMVVNTQSEVAAFFGLSVRAIQNGLANGCPGRRGHYDLGKIHAWRQSRHGGSSAKGAQSGEDAEGKNYWDARFRRARALLVEVELQRTEDQYVLLALVRM